MFIETLWYIINSQGLTYAGIDSKSNLINLSWIFIYTKGLDRAHRMYI